MKKIIFTSAILLWACSSDPYSTVNLITNFSGTLVDIKLIGGSDEEVGRELIELRQGGFAMIGSTKSKDGDFGERSTDNWDLFLMKLDQQGEVIWTRTYGGSAEDFGFSLLETPTEGFVLMGYSSSQDGDVPPTKGYHDNWIIKVDAAGELLWKKSLGYSGHDHAYNVIATQDGGYFFNGFLDVTASNGFGNSGKSSQAGRHGVGEFWCHKVDTHGNIQWQRYFGGTNNDKSYDAIETQEGNFLVVGTSESDDLDVKNPKGSYDIWVVMISPTGEMLWENSYGGSLVDEASKVIQDFNGNYRIIGNTHSEDMDVSNPKGMSDAWQITLDPMGKLIESHNYGGSEFDKGTAIAEGTGGSLFITGFSRSLDGDFRENMGENDIFLLYLTADGSEKSTFSWGGEDQDFAYDVLIPNNGGGVFVVGQSFSKNTTFTKNKGKSDILLAHWR